MFANLKPQPADKILQLIGQFKADPRADKIDLGVGVIPTNHSTTG